MLIICCSPEEEQAQETLSTLKFGECAKRVTTFASANVVAAPDEVGAQLAQLRAEVVRLKRQARFSLFCIFVLCSVLWCCVLLSCVVCGWFVLIGYPRVSLFPPSLWCAMEGRKEGRE